MSESILSESVVHVERFSRSSYSFLFTIIPKLSRRDIVTFHKLLRHITGGIKATQTTDKLNTVIRGCKKLHGLIQPVADQIFIWRMPGIFFKEIIAAGFTHASGPCDFFQ